MIKYFINKHSEIASINSMNIKSSLYLERNILSAIFQSNENDYNVNPEVDTFQESLTTAFVQGNLTHTQKNLILKILRFCVFRIF